MSGVGECVKALKATKKVGKVSLGPRASAATLVAAYVSGEKPASLTLPALEALTPKCAAVRSECKLQRVPVVAADVLLGGERSRLWAHHRGEGGGPFPSSPLLMGPS